MTTDAPVGRRHTVRLVDVPLALFREAEQHTDDLLRELLLMAGYEAAHGVDGPATSLARRADEHRAGRLGVTLSADTEADGETVTLTYDLTLDAAASAEEWARLLDDLAALCRTGQMLSVPARPEVEEFSRWFCTEVVRQLREVS